MDKITPAIVVPAFSRPASLHRILTSIENSELIPEVYIVISIDGGAAPEVLAVANDFNFSVGCKRIIEHKVNLGLRNHILFCGDLSFEYGAVIVLEDDLFADKYFYMFAHHALTFYDNNDLVAGIALYSPRYNDFAKLPFEPLQNNLSGYFMQIACSSGQAWSSKQWAGFKNWYKHRNETSVSQNYKLPHVVKNWPESSWKKYFASYLAEQDVYMFYPFISYTTNCSDDGGTHIKDGSNLHHVTLRCQQRNIDTFLFPEATKESIVYDSFMEPSSDILFSSIGMSKDMLAIDLYGIKPLKLIEKHEYVVTSKAVRYYQKSYRLGFRPIDLFYLNAEAYNKSSSGESFFLAKTKDINGRNQRYFLLARNYTSIPIISRKFIKALIMYLFKYFANKLRI